MKPTQPRKREFLCHQIVEFSFHPIKVVGKAQLNKQEHNPLSPPPYSLLGIRLHEHHAPNKLVAEDLIQHMNPH